MGTCKTCKFRPGKSGACINGCSAKWAHFVAETDTCNEWESADCYEVFRESETGANIFLARAKTAKEVGEIIEVDMQSNGGTGYRAHYLGGAE